MKRFTYAWLVCRAVAELLLFDITHRACGFQGTLRLLARSPAPAPRAPVAERTVCDAVLLATCLYWKPVRCLQRSHCTVRLLRSHGIMARLVIGYRATPFFSHAWVEADGRVVNDSPVYRQRLQILHIV